jgi:FkbM family methyltransferase
MKRIKKALRPYRWLRYMLKNGHWTPQEMWNSNFTFSQFGEDLLLQSFFGPDLKKGFYVDVGAYHPILISNTYLFYRKGWSGINIEPNPIHFKLFPEERKNDTNLNLAVSDSKSMVEFSCDGAFSGIRDKSYPFSNRNKDATIISVATCTLTEILEKYLPEDKKIDFMTIDCEGHDYNVVKSNDWFKYRPRIVLVEQHGRKIEGNIFNHMVSKGYKFYCKIGLTLAFIADEESGRFLPSSI